jgi:hypothetical protein
MDQIGLPAKPIEGLLAALFPATLVVHHCCAFSQHPYQKNFWVNLKTAWKHSVRQGALKMLAAVVVNTTCFQVPGFSPDSTKP